MAKGPWVHDQGLIGSQPRAYLVLLKKLNNKRNKMLWLQRMIYITHTECITLLYEWINLLSGFGFNNNII